MLLSLLVLTAIIFAHEASRFTELLVVSSRQGLPMQALWKLMAALVPGILVFTLPISLLLGTLVGLGRMSGDSEITAMLASGISRIQILKPVIALAVITIALMTYITFSVLPDSVANLINLKSNRSLVFQGLNTQIKPRVFEESIPGKVLYIEDIDRSTNLWHNIFIVDLGDEQDDLRIFTATTGSLRQGEKSVMPELHLSRGSVHQISSMSQEQSEQKPSTDIASGSAQQDKEKDRERRRNRNHQQYTANWFSDMTLGIESRDVKKEDNGEARPISDDVRTMRWSTLISYNAPAEKRREWSAEVHKRLVLPTACLVFVLLAVAFGITHVRAGRPYGLLLGLAITVIYYLIALWGEHAAISGKLPVWVGMWLANVILGTLGLMTLLSQRRPGSDPLSLLGGLQRSRASRKEARKMSKKSEQAGSVKATGNLSRPRVEGASKGGQFHLPQLIDRLVLKDLARFFFYILAGFSTLFIIITLFQLLEYINRNNIETIIVADYLFFLLPMIINYTIPIAALVAVMVTFGVLQKTSQVIALKASGQSIFRIAAPVLLASVILSAVVFFNQDYILPFTNRRQNNLRYLIRKGQEPPQTFYQTKNQWIFGQESRIFNYAYFDLNSNSFLRLNVIDLSREPFGIKRRVYARKAYWDSRGEEWVFENGWERRYDGDRLLGFEQFRERREKLVEQPQYFKKDSRGSQSMTLAELRRKIADLSQSGFDVLELRIQFQTKIAFPLACLVMVMVGLPFSLTVGKRGALYGVALGIGIGLAYWGSLGLFEQMGRYELLPPLLAAWGPNLLFGAGGLYFFLTSRT